MRQLLGIAFIFFFAFAVEVSWAQQDGKAKLEFYVFRNGRPVPGLTVTVGDNTVKTDALGGVSLEIPEGSHDLILRGEDSRLLDLPLTTANDENIQVLVTLKGEGQEPEVEIERSGEAAALAQQSRRQALQSDKTPGELSGRIVSAEDGEPIAKARVFISGLATSAQTNEQGEFTLKAPPGSYELSVVHPDFATQTLSDVAVNSGEVATRNVELAPAGTQLEEYVVTSPYIEGSVASIVERQKEATGVSEILGAELMSQAGDSDAAEALQRVTGLTVEDDKYIVIRGQPSRYTLSLFNASQLPSPDPIRRVVPLDLFPTDVLAGIEVQKTYSVDRPGGFGGGLVNLNTRGIPEEGFAEVTIGTGYNTESTGKQGLTYDGGDETLGAADATLDLPGPVAAITNAGGSVGSLPEDERNDLGKTFPNNYAVEETTLPLDQSLSVAAGKNYDTRLGRFGVLGSFSWSREWRNRIEQDRDFKLGNDNELDVLNDRTEQRTDLDIQLGGLLVLKGEWTDHSLTSNTFIIRDTTKRTEIAEGITNVSDNLYVRDYLLEWNQREMFATQLIGEHDFDFTQIEWRFLTAEGERYSPDRRTYREVRLPDDSFVFFEETGAQRRYNTVEDQIDDINLDATFPLIDNDAFKAKVKSGVASYIQERDSETLRFRFEPEGVDVSQDVEDIFDPSNIGNGVSFNDDTGANDDYNGTAEVQGAYIRGDIEFVDTLRLVGGIRQESADFEVTSFQSATGSTVEPVTGGFENSRLLPSLVATWFMNDTMQLRGGYSTTVSRPVLVELSQTTFFDPDTGQEYLGNPDLKPAIIDSFDLRWEWYPSSTQSLTAGVFLKQYQDPIERNFVAFAGGGELITLQNADEATVTGVEVGGRYELGGRVNEHWWDALYLQGNVALIDSEVTLQEGGVATNSTRPLEGQAEYVVNVQLGFEGERHDWNLAFNQVGRRLTTAGVQGLPDVYQEPVPVLDAVWSYRPWENGTIRFTASNILDPDHEFTQGGKVERTYKKGVDYSLSFKWRF